MAVPYDQLPKVNMRQVETMWEFASTDIDHTSFLDAYGGMTLEDKPGEMIWDLAIARRVPLIAELISHAEAYTGSAFGAEPTVQKHDVPASQWELYQNPTLRVAYALIALDFGIEGLAMLHHAQLHNIMGMGEARECEHKWRKYDEPIGIVCRDCGADAPEDVKKHWQDW